MQERARRGERVPGFGHAVLRRAPATRARACCSSWPGSAARAPEVADRERGDRRDGARRQAARRTSTRAAVALRAALGMPAGAVAGLFAVGRAAGWVAHALEQVATGHLLRPRARYKGPRLPRAEGAVSRTARGVRRGDAAAESVAVCLRRARGAPPTNSSCSASSRYVVLLLSLTVHEAAHAWAALRGGDPTAYLGGQVSLDPRPHIRREPFGMVFAPLLFFFMGGWMIGWASTPIDPRWAYVHPKRAAVMSAAGPLANLALVAARRRSALRVGVAAGWFMPVPVGTFALALAPAGGVAESVILVLSLVFSLNLILFVFNLIPVPPLDGASVIGLFVSGADGTQAAAVDGAADARARRPAAGLAPDAARSSARCSALAVEPALRSARAELAPVGSNESGPGRGPPRMRALPARAGGPHEALLGTALAVHRQGPHRPRREGPRLRARRGGLEPRAPLRAAPPGRARAQPEGAGARARGRRRSRSTTRP